MNVEVHHEQGCMGKEMGGRSLPDNAVACFRLMSPSGLTGSGVAVCKQDVRV